MTAEQSVLLQLIRAALTDAAVALSDGVTVDWSSVAKEAQQQAVSLLAFDAAAAVAEQIPAEVYRQWTERAFAAMSVDARIDHIQQELTALLDRDHHPYVILKGAASAAYYPKAELRTQGDIDFLIDPAQSEAISSLLQQNGYIAENIHSDHHTVFKKAGVVLEMHFREPAIPQGAIGDKINRFLSGNIHQPQPFNNGTHPFHAPTDSRHGLILLLHSQHHMLSEGLGLRHLCDWACFVQKTADAPFWTNFVPFLQEIGLFTYASVITQLCATYFGTPTPDWVKPSEDTLCRDLLTDVFTGGNFGRKDRLRARSGMMISNAESGGTKRSRLYYLTRTLNDVIKAEHPSVNRLPILYPIFGIQKIVLYGLKVLCGKRLPIGALAAKADERKSVYSQLQLFEVTEK